MTDHFHSISHSHSISSYPIYTSDTMPYGTILGSRDGFYGTEATWARMIETYNSTLTTPKESPMTILEQMRKERKEAIERQRIERVYAAYDEAPLDEHNDGTVLVFTWQPEGTDKSYCYAALWTNEKWYVTGRESPNGLDTEDFVAWLIGKDIEPDDLEVRAP